MYIGLHVTYLLFLWECNQPENFHRFSKIQKCQISWKSIQREPSCSMRPDRHDKLNNRFSQLCERAQKWRKVYVMLSLYVFVSFAFLVGLHTLDFMFIYFRKIQGDKVIKNTLSFLKCSPHWQFICMIFVDVSSDYIYIIINLRMGRWTYDS